jgi:hypothetical protein
VSNETFAEKGARQCATNKANKKKQVDRLGQERADRTAYEVNKDKDLTPIEPDKLMSLPMAVRHTEWFKNLGYLQTPGVRMIDVSKVGGWVGWVLC